MLLLSGINMYSLHHSSQTQFHSTFDHFILCVEDHIQRVEASSFVSHWRAVKSGVYQGSILGSVLFNVFISYVKSGIPYSLSKFVDNTQLCGMADTPDGQDAIRKCCGLSAAGN